MKLFILFIFLILIYSGNVNAYVGPGLGAGVIAAIAGVFLSIVMAIIGVFWYPIKRLFKKSEPEENLEENLEEIKTQAQPQYAKQAKNKDNQQ